MEKRTFRLPGFLVLLVLLGVLAGFVWYAIDQDGRQTTLLQSSLTNGEYFFRLRVPVTARKLDFTFAVQRTRTVEFVAKPRGGANVSASKHSHRRQP